MRNASLVMMPLFIVALGRGKREGNCGSGFTLSAAGAIPSLSSLPLRCQLSDTPLDRAYLHALRLVIFAVTLSAFACVDLEYAFFGADGCRRAFRFAVTACGAQLCIDSHCHDESPFKFRKGKGRRDRACGAQG
jgi:hypothetical protein